MNEIPEQAHVKVQRNVPQQVREKCQVQVPLNPYAEIPVKIPLTNLLLLLNDKNVQFRDRSVTRARHS